MKRDAIKKKQKKDDFLVGELSRPLVLSGGKHLVEYIEKTRKLIEESKNRLINETTI